MNRWTVGILVGICLSLLTVPVWADVNFTLNNVPTASILPGDTNVLLLDFTLNLVTTDYVVNDEGTLNANNGDALLSLSGYKYVDIDSSGTYNTGDEVFQTTLDNVLQGDDPIDTDGMATANKGAAPDEIPDGATLTAFGAVDKVYFDDANNDGVWETGEDLFYDGSGDQFPQTNEIILGNTTVNGTITLVDGTVNLVYYDKNDNGVWDNGEDIFDSSTLQHAGVFTRVNEATCAIFNKGDDTVLDTQVGATLTAVPANDKVADSNGNSNIDPGEDIVYDGNTNDVYNAPVADHLSAFTFQNSGTAVDADVATWHVYKDGGDGTFEGSAAGDDTALCTITWNATTSNWEVTDLGSPSIGAGTAALRIFVAADIATAAAQGDTFQLLVPQFSDTGGDGFTSGVDEGVFLQASAGVPASDQTNTGIQTISGDVVNTTKGKAYATIQAAIDDADANDTITVATGTYVEDLTVDKALTLTGTNVTLTGSVHFSAASITMTGFTISGEWYVDSDAAHIADAISAASAGDTINVAAGTYNESINVNKTLDLLGPNAAISPNTGTRVAEAIIVVPGSAGALTISANDVQLKGFTIQASATYVATGGNTLLAIKGDGVLVEKNIVDTTTYSTNPMSAIWSEPHSGWTITDNRVLTDGGGLGGNSDGGMDLYGGGSTGSHNTVSDNVLIHDNTGGGYGIAISTDAGGCAYWDVTGNTLTNYNSGIQLVDYTTTAGYGISHIALKLNAISDCKYGVWFYGITGDTGAGISNVTLEGNAITSNLVGIEFESGATNIDVATIDVNYNRISGNTSFGIENPIAAQLDATRNYWGSTTGPTHASNAGGAGDTISDNVTYRPWLNGIPTADYADNSVKGGKTVQLGTGTTYYWMISDAITAATQTGSTIIVGDGTYAETLAIDKDLTIKSENGAASTIIEAGTDHDIITVNTGCDLALGEAGAAKGFTIGFDSDAVSAPTANKIVHNGDVLNLYRNLIDDQTSSVGVLINSSTATGTIAGNTIQDCNIGIYLKDCGNFLVGGDTQAEGNTITLNTTGVQIDSGSHSFKWNQFLDNTSDGVKITNAASAAGTVFHGTAGNKFTGNTTYAIENTSGTDVDARYCYWGDATGPYNASSNPNGQGDEISANVLYSPWLMSWPDGPLASAYDTATHTFTLGYHDGYNDGWQLLSIPLNAADPSPEAVFDELGTLVIYQYDECQTPSNYVRPSQVKPTGGYWVYFLGDKAITVEGATIQDQITVTLGCAGWQMIGVPTVAIPITHNETDNPGAPDIMFSTDGTTWLTYAQAYGTLIAPGSIIWRYDNSTGQYVGVGEYDVLDPWTGYWLKTAVDDVQMKISVEYWLTHAPVPPSGAASYLPMSANAETPPPPPSMPKNLAAAMDKSGLIVYNEPNPIRDVHTTTFKVKSAVPIEAIRVEIFNQAGQLVFKDEQLGDELAWHTDNDYGEYLANGVYLYRVSAKVSGQWVVTSVRKLAIYR